MRQITKRTQFYRATLTQEARVIVDPDDCYRRVRVMAPRSPMTGYALDVAPKDIGFNDFYRLSPYDSVDPLVLELAPGQWLIGASQDGNAFASVIVEFFEQGPALP